jgi:hypothetical protein
MAKVMSEKAGHELDIECESHSPVPSHTPTLLLGKEFALCFFW